MAEASINKLLQKRELLAMKVTTKICGKTKYLFVEDCINKDLLETDLAKHIIDTYYMIVSDIPNNQYLECSRIKDYIKNNITFKKL